MGRILEGTYESYRHPVTQELGVQNDAKPKHPMTSFWCSRQMCFLGGAKHRKYTVNERKAFVPVICQLPRTTSSPRRSRVSRPPCSESFVCHPNLPRRKPRNREVIQPPPRHTAEKCHLRTLSPSSVIITTLHSLCDAGLPCLQQRDGTMSPRTPQQPSSNILLPHCCNSQTQN